MAFEAFTREFVRTTDPKVTITSLGRFSINNSASALLKQGMAGRDFVILMWDKETNRSAIRPAKKGENGAYPLKAYGPKGKSGTGFSAVTFLNFINYDWSKTRSFAAEWIDNMLIFSIPTENTTGRPAAQDTELGAVKRKDRLK